MASIQKEKIFGTSHSSNALYDSKLPLEGSVKKRLRRKVRATEDFNHLNRSSLAMDSNIYKVYSDSDSKKTRKQKVMTFLPAVVWPEKENSLPNVKLEESRSKQKSRRTGRGLKKNGNSLSESSTEPTSESTSEREMSDERKLRRRKVKLVEVNHTETSGKNMKNNTNNLFTNITSGNSSEEVEEKINCFGKNTEGNQNNSLTDSTSETSSEKVVEKRKRRGKRTKLITPGKSEMCDEQRDFEDSDLEFKTKKKNKKIKSAKPLNNDGHLSKKVSFRVSKSFNDAKTPNKPYKSSPKMIISNEEENQSSNSNVSPDEVLNRTFEINELVNKEDLPKVELRKSVRFFSPTIRHPRVKKSTISIDNSITDVSSIKSPGNDSQVEKCTFRKSTPHVKKLKLSIVDKNSMTKGTLEYSTEDSPESDDNIHEKNLTLNTSSNVSRLSNNRKSAKISDSFQLTKGKYITSRKKSQGIDVLENTSPSIYENSKLKNSKLSTTESSIKSILRHNRSTFAFDTDHNISKPKRPNRSTFDLPSPIHYCSTRSLKTPLSSKKQSVINLITPTPEKEKLFVTISESPPNSVCGDTFSIEEGNLPNISSNMTRENKYNGTSEKVKTSDDDIPGETSMVQKRKRWNKSLGVSFLDNSGNVHNIMPLLHDETFPDILVTSDEPDLNLIDTVKTPKQKINSTKKTIGPCGSSTPLVRIRRISEKEKNTSNSTSVSVNVSKPITRTKMPNFALIHQRAYDKLENLKEMSERKATRAKQLLSGHKPNAETSLKSPSKSRKILKYSPKAGRRAIPTLKPSKMKNTNLAVNVMTKVIVPSTSNPKVTSLHKPMLRKVEITKVKSCIPKPILKKVNEEKKTLTRLGFKINHDAVKKPSKEEQVKAVTARSKIVNTSVESRRNVVQNIRTNRRFELLMKMRNKK